MTTRYDVPLQTRARQLRLLTRAGSLSRVATTTFLLAPAVALVFSFLTMIEGCATGKGPMLGAEAPLVCPLVCDGCEPPFTYFSWVSHSGSGSRSRSGTGGQIVFCDSTTLRPSAMDWTSLFQVPHAQAVPGGPLALLALTYLLVFPLAFIVAFALAVVLRMRNLERSKSSARELDRVEWEMAQAGYQPAALPRVRDPWPLALLVCVVMGALMGSCVGVELRSIESEPPARAP